MMSPEDILTQREEAAMEHQHGTCAATAVAEKSTVAIERQGGQSARHIRRKRQRPGSQLVISARAHVFRKRVFPTCDTPRSC